MITPILSMGLLDTCTEEAYARCKMVINGETFSNVAICGKENPSLTQVKQYGNDKYSFNLEFDHYDASNLYYGLDKVCLNNVVQDNTYMKDYLTYQRTSGSSALPAIKLKIEFYFHLKEMSTFFFAAYDVIIITTGGRKK